MLLGLPLELLVSVCLRLPVPDLLRLATTCRDLRAALHHDDALWRSLALRDFGAALLACPPPLLPPAHPLPALTSPTPAAPASSSTVYRALAEPHATRAWRSVRRRARLAEWAMSVDAMVRVCALGPRRSGKTSALHALALGLVANESEYVPTDSLDSFTLFASTDRRLIVRLLDAPGDVTACLPLVPALYDECDVVLLFRPDGPIWLNWIAAHTDAPTLILLDHSTPSLPFTPEPPLASGGQFSILNVPSDRRALRGVLLHAVMGLLPPPPAPHAPHSPSPLIAGPYAPASYSLTRTARFAEEEEEEEEAEGEVDGAHNAGGYG